MYVGKNLSATINYDIEEMGKSNSSPKVNPLIVSIKPLYKMSVGVRLFDKYNSLI